MAEAGDKRETPLDDVMLAMDVVDQLRYRARLVERELDSEARERDLLKRLREIYAGQGIEVPDAILRQGIETLAEDRFSYEPPRPSFQVSLAKLYVRRGTWGRAVLIGGGLAAAIWAGYAFLVAGPRERQSEQARIELSESLPKRVAGLRAAIQEEAKVPAARVLAKNLAEAALAAARGGNGEAARKAEADLRVLAERLRRVYTLRIVQAKGKQSGVWRVPKANPNARNYYLIVEAVDPAGRVLELPVANEETGKTETVASFGVRVAKEVFERVRKDKAADGIVDRRDIGAKAHGHLEPRYTVPVTGGTITSW